MSVSMDEGRWVRGGEGRGEKEKWSWCLRAQVGRREKERSGGQGAGCYGEKASGLRY